MAVAWPAQNLLLAGLIDHGRRPGRVGDRETRQHVFRRLRLQAVVEHEDVRHCGVARVKRERVGVGWPLKPCRQIERALGRRGVRPVEKCPDRSVDFDQEEPLRFVRPRRRHGEQRTETAKFELRKPAFIREG